MKKEIAKPPTFAQTGWCWSNSIIFIDQHHPGASRHPSSAEEGTPDSALARPFIHTFYDRAYKEVEQNAPPRWRADLHRSW